MATVQGYLLGPLHRKLTTTAYVIPAHKQGQENAHAERRGGATNGFGLRKKRLPLKERFFFFKVFDFGYFPAFKILELKRYLQNTCTKYIK